MRWFIAAALTATMIGPASGEVRYVDDDAPAGGDGVAWSSAYRHLQDALAEAAASAGAIDEIRIAGGVQRPDRDEAGAVAAGDRDATFAPTANLLLAGSYAGLGAKDPDARDVALHPTVLSGDLDGNDGPNFTNRGDNSRHVVRVAPTGVVLDRLVVSGGRANGTTDFKDRGGGILVEEDAEVVLDHCALTDNWSRQGGAMEIERATARFLDCTVTGNYGDGKGGAIHTNDATVEFHRCRIDGNESDFRGGGMYLTHSTALLRDTSVSGNVATATGGGLYTFYGVTDVARCAFDGNVAGSAGGYGAIGNDTTIADSRFNGNVTPTVGAGLYVRGSATVMNSIMIGNEAERGAGLYVLQESTADFRNCTVAGNRADLGPGFAAESYTVPSVVTFANCIVRNGGDEVHNADGSSITMTYTNITGGWPGAGNIDADAQFVDLDGADDVLGTGDDDPRLGPVSPSVDAGDNGAVPADALDVDDDGDVDEPWPLDMLGAPRFANEPAAPDVGAGESPIVDQGAVERQPPGCPDLDGDGAVGFGDLLLVLANWGPCGGCDADVDDDGVVGFADLLWVLSNWGPCA